MQRKTWWLLLRLIVTVALEYWLLSRVDLDKTWRILSNAQPLFVTLALAVFVAQLIVGGIRWQVLLCNIGIRVPLPQLISYNLVGVFFNLFMPGTTGGDLVRVCDIVQVPSGDEKVAAGMTVVALSGCSGFLYFSLWGGFPSCWVDIAC